MEAGGIDCAVKRGPLVKTPYLARIADRYMTYSDIKVCRRTPTDKDFAWSTRIFTRNREYRDTRLAWALESLIRINPSSPQQTPSGRRTVGRSIG